MLKKSLWWFAILFIIGLAGGVALRPTILSYAATNFSGNQISPGDLSASDQALIKAANLEPAPVTNLPAPISEPTQTEKVINLIPAAPASPAGAGQVALVVDQSKIDSIQLDSYDGLPAGFTEEGYPYLGDPAAPVTVEEYSDLLCPFCARHFSQTLPTLIDKYIKTGQVKYVFRDMPLVGLHPTAPIGHVGAACAGEQGAAFFWLMHEALFKRQNEWSRLPDPTDFVAGLAAAGGVDMAIYQQCLSAGQQASRVDESIAIGRGLNFNGTPSFQFIQHEKEDAVSTLIGAHPIGVFEQRLDALIAGEAIPEPEKPEPGELPFWANPAGLAPDPDRPGFTMAGDPYKGDPEAKLVVVEFADFQCPACQRHALETQPVVETQFIETDRIMWVFKPLPLREHAHATTAAVAAECAGRQGQFWPMYHLLFETLTEWSTADNPDAALLALADQLPLEADPFRVCFNSRQALETVLHDMYDAQGVAQTTPTFIFLVNGRGSVLKGAQPADQFVRRVAGMLEQAKNSP